MGTVDFQIEIVETRSDWVVSCKTAYGSAVRVVPTPFEAVQLERRLGDIETSIVRSTGTPLTRRVNAPSQVALRFGTELTDILFSGDAALLFDRCRENARRDGSELRVLVSPVGPTVARVPWEFATDPHRDYEHLALRSPVVRFPHLMGQVPPLAVTPPLRVLGVVSRPSDSPGLDSAQERQSVTDALSRLSADLVHIEWLEGDQWHDLAAALRDETWHVLHYIGHGGYDEEIASGYIELSDTRGLATRLPAPDLARRVSENPSLRLVVLNSCESATVSPEQGVFSSTAAKLMKEGLPAVIAMQYEISDPSALAFSFGLYDGIARNLPLDRAVTVARDAVKMTTSSLEWATPVLFLASDETRIFSVRSDAGPPTVEESVPQRVEGALQEVLTHRLTAVEAPAAATPAPPPVSAPATPATGSAPRDVDDGPPSPRPDRRARLRATLPTGPCRATAALAGGMLACVGIDGTLHVTRLSDGRVMSTCSLPRPDGRADPALRVRGTPWARHAVTLHASGAVVVWDLETRAPVRVVPGPPGVQVRRCAVGGNGVRIATSSTDLAVRVLGADGQVEWTARLERDSSPAHRGLGFIGPLAFLDDDHTVLVGGDDGLLREVTRHGLRRQGWSHSEPVVSLAPVTTSGQVATGCRDGVVRIWNLDESDRPAEHLDAAGPVRSVRSIGPLVASVTDDEVCRVWDPADDDAPLLTTSGEFVELTLLDQVPTAVVTSRDGGTHVWGLGDASTARASRGGQDRA